MVKGPHPLRHHGILDRRSTDLDPRSPDARLRVGLCVLLSMACLLPVTGSPASAASSRPTADSATTHAAGANARATNTLYVLGGPATITKEWFRDGPTYSARYSGKLTDYRGDGGHVRLYVSAHGGPTPFRIQRRATRGQTVRFSSNWFPADRLVFQLCAYDRDRQVQCGGVW